MSLPLYFRNDCGPFYEAQDEGAIMIDRVSGK